MSMVKIVPPGSYDFGEAQVQLVKVSGRGLIGADRSIFEKRASASFMSQLPSLLEKVGKDETLIHEITVGATSAWGCFVSGTPIAMGNGQYLPIQDVQVGDAVLSADGRICDVSHLFKRDVPETVRIDVSGNADMLHCSVNHPFRVARQEQFVCDHDCYKRCLPPLQGQQNICNRTASPRACVLATYRNIDWEWATADTLRPGDFLIWTCPDVTPVLPLNVHEGYLLGAWFAEGSFCRQNNGVTSVSLDIHANESEFLARLYTCAAALSLTVRDYRGKNRHANSRSVRIGGDPERFRTWWALFGEYSDGKRLPPWICCLPRPVRLAMLAGYIDGDGHSAVSTKENRTTAFSCGQDLSLGMQRLAWSLGIPAVRCQVKSTGGWHLSIANGHLTDLVHFSWKVKPRRLQQTTKVHGFYHAGKMYLPVRSISAAGPATVFNFEVAGDHTYSGPNIDSHNCNRNGDGFTEETCIKYCPTFEKFAWHFRDHCFPAGTFVTMGDRQRLPIENVVIGDVVDTLDGPKAVTAVMRRSYAGDGCTLRISGLPRPITATANHPILVLRREQVHCRHKYSRLLRGGRHGLKCPEWRQGLDDITPSYVPAAQIKPGDYVLTPKPIHGNMRVEPAFAQLVGWVASEGYIGKKCIQFSFSAKNTVDIAKVKACLHANGCKTVTLTPRDDYGLVMVTVSNAGLRTELLRFIAGTKNKKRLTAAIMEWDAASLAEMLAAYIDGDGNVCDKQYRYGQLRIRSSSPQMLYALRDIVNALGIPATTNIDCPPRKMRAPTNGKTYQANGAGVLAINAHFSAAITAKSRKYVSPCKHARALAPREIGNMIMSRVTAVSHQQLQCDVFNLEVAGPHNYVANEIIVHNCNKPNDPFYGRIVKAAYNPEMKRIELLKALFNTKAAAERHGPRGRPADKELEKLAANKEIPVSMSCLIPFDECFRAGTLVDTAIGMQPIETVSVNTQVRTHLGRYRRVSQVRSRDYAGTMVDLTVTGVPETVSMTKNHPVFAVRREQFATCRGRTNGQRRRHTLRRGGSQCTYCQEQITLLPDWVAADKLQVGDLVTLPVTRPGDVESVSVEFAYLLGMYIGNGSRIQQGRGADRQGEPYLQGISLSLGMAWPAVRDKVVAVVTALTGRAPKCYVNDERSEFSIRIYDQAIAERCLCLGGHGARTKRIAEEVFEWGPASRRGLLAGLLDSDGCVDKTHRYGSGRHSTSNRTLAGQLQQLWGGLGIFTGMFLQNENGQGFTSDGSYIVSVSSFGVAQLADDSIKAAGVACQRTRSVGFLLGNYLCMPITEVRHYYDETTVYNFEVEDDESYSVGFAVHNCSFCHNKAPSTKDYCTGTYQGGQCKAGGLRDNIGRMIEIDGGIHHLHADNNTDVKFFDSSHVFRGAERTAFFTGAIEKAAAAGGKILKSAELAQQLGVEIPYHLLTPSALPTTSNAVARQVKIAQLLAELDRNAAAGQCDKTWLPAVTPEAQRLDNAFTLPEFAREKFAVVQRALTDARICLPLPHWIELACGASREKAAAVAAVVSRELPGAYSRLLADATLPTKLASNPYTAAPAAPAGLKAWAMKMASALSLRQQYLHDRVILAALRGAADVELRGELPREKVASATAAEGQLAEQYALYQLAFLEGIPETDSEFPLTASLAVLQNHTS